MGFLIWSHRKLREATQDLGGVCVSKPVQIFKSGVEVRVDVHDFTQIANSQIYVD